MSDNNLYITYRGLRKVSSDEREAVEKAVAVAQRLSRSMAQDMEKIWQQQQRGQLRKRQTAWLKNSKFRKWLGEDALNKNQITRTRRTIRQIRKHFNDDLVKIKIQTLDARGCGKKEFTAFVRTGPVIHLCPVWFEKKMSLKTQASILIHEAAHLKIALLGTPFHRQSFDAGTAATTARLYPRKARRAPENYLRLSREYF